MSLTIGPSRRHFSTPRAERKVSRPRIASPRAATFYPCRIIKASLRMSKTLITNLSDNPPGRWHRPSLGALSIPAAAHLPRGHGRRGERGVEVCYPCFSNGMEASSANVKCKLDDTMRLVSRRARSRLAMCRSWSRWRFARVTSCIPCRRP